MNVSEWQKGKLHRIYINDSAFSKKVYIDIVKNPKIKAESKIDEKVLVEHLKNHNIDLTSLSLIKDLKSVPTISGTKGFVIRQKFDKFNTNEKTPQELHIEAEKLDVSKPKILVKTVKNIRLKIDHREPDDIKEIFKNTVFNETLSFEQLTIGDFVAEDIETGDVLVFERKTITDFNNSIKASDHRAHSQAERLYKYKNELIKSGKNCKVVWIIECENKGSRTLYNTLPMIQQVDGMINYLDFILGQSVVQSFNKNHTVYLAIKFIQGFFEKELRIPVKIFSSGKRIDSSKKDKNLPCKNNEKVIDNTGVVSSNKNLESLLSFFPNIKSNVAYEFVKTGKSLKEIVCMDLEEIEKIKGVGKKTAIRIFETFNKK